MAKCTYLNRFKEYHNYLKETDPQKFSTCITSICHVLGIEQSSYYRKLQNPGLLSIADKEAIAKVYQLPVHFIFPELQDSHA